MLENITQRWYIIQRNTWFRNLILVYSFQTLKPVVHRTFQTQRHIQQRIYYLKKNLIRKVHPMSTPIVKVNEGEVKGKVVQDYLGNDFFSFLGIPYAEPPIGELRFKPPAPVKPWEGVLDATNEGPECPARHMLFGYQIGSEDNCLNLNIHTKALPSDNTQLKPVMVWIHGGGFLYGSNRNELYGPNYLLTEDIVLVAINYRLGIFGFLSLEDPSLGVPGNAGLKDMVLALKWIQANIKHFNGDPNNVTIFGESAGGASVHNLFLSPTSKGLFHKAIAQSGCALNCWARGETNGKVAAECVGYKETDEKKILEYLQNAPISKLIKASYKPLDIFTADTVRPFGPVVEPYTNETTFLSEDPLTILKNGTFNQVPIMMGFTSREGIFFDVVRKLIPQAKITTDFETEIFNDLNLKKGTESSKEVAKSIQEFYFGDEKPTENNIDKLHVLKSDIQFIYAIHRCVSLQKLISQNPIYFYRMSLDTSINHYKKICSSRAVTVLFFCYYLTYKSGEGMAKSLFLKLSNTVPKKSPEGVCHADDLGYLFHSFLSPKLEPGSIEEISIKRFVKLWTNFAKHSNPTPDLNDELLNKVQWKPVEKDCNNFLDIGETLTTGTNPEPERLKFWDDIYSKYSK